MTVMQALENVLARAKALAPLAPAIVPAVVKLGGDFSGHASALTDLADAVQLAEAIVKDATGI